MASPPRQSARGTSAEDDGLCGLFQRPRSRGRTLLSLFPRRSRPQRDTRFRGRPADAATPSLHLRGHPGDMAVAGWTRPWLRLASTARLSQRRGQSCDHGHGRVDGSRGRGRTDEAVAGLAKWSRAPSREGRRGAHRRISTKQRRERRGYGPICGGESARWRRGGVDKRAGG